MKLDFLTPKEKNYLEKLLQYKLKGIITEEEYDNKKNKILQKSVKLKKTELTKLKKLTLLKNKGTLTNDEYQLAVSNLLKKAALKNSEKPKEEKTTPKKSIRTSIVQGANIIEVTRKEGSFMKRMNEEKKINIDFIKYKKKVFGKKEELERLEKEGDEKEKLLIKKKKRFLK